MKITAYVNQKIFELNREDRKKGKPIVVKAIRPSEDRIHCDPRCLQWRGHYCCLFGFLKIDNDSDRIRSGDCFSEEDRLDGISAKAAKRRSIDPKVKMYEGYGFICEGFFETFNFNEEKIAKHIQGLNDARVQADYLLWLSKEYIKAYVLPIQDIFERDKKEKEMNRLLGPFENEVMKNLPEVIEPFETRGFNIKQVLLWANSYNFQRRIKYFEWIIMEAETAIRIQTTESGNANDFAVKLEEFQKAIRAQLEYLKKWLSPEIANLSEHSMGTNQNKQPEPILWTGTKEQLAKTIDVLVERGCVPGERQYKCFAEHVKWYNKRTERFEGISNEELSVLSARTPATRKKVKTLEDDLNQALST